MPYTEERVLETIGMVRPVLEQVSHKWSILVLTFLCEEPKRFNALRRRVDGITQKALTETLRRLERNGLIDRTVTTLSPIAVVYSITPLGRTLQAPFLALYDWAVEHEADLRDAQGRFDLSILSRDNVEHRVLTAFESDRGGIGGMSGAR